MFDELWTRIGGAWHQPPPPMCSRHFSANDSEFSFIRTLDVVPEDPSQQMQARPVLRGPELGETNPVKLDAKYPNAQLKPLSPFLELFEASETKIWGERKKSSGEGICWKKKPVIREMMNFIKKKKMESDKNTSRGGSTEEKTEGLDLLLKASHLIQIITF
jgi:hypothetical protein